MGLKRIKDKSGISYYLAVVTCLVLADTSCNKASYPDSNTRFLNSSISYTIKPPKDSSQNLSITINGNGDAELVGGDKSIKPGRYKGLISHKTIHRLFNELECSNFFDFHSEYGSYDNEKPISYLSFRHRGFVKEIISYSDRPEELQKIENEIIEILKNKNQHWESLN